MCSYSSLSNSQWISWAFRLHSPLWSHGFLCFLCGFGLVVLHISCLFIFVFVTCVSKPSSGMSLCLLFQRSLLFAQVCSGFFDFIPHFVNCSISVESAFFPLCCLCSYIFVCLFGFFPFFFSLKKDWYQTNMGCLCYSMTLVLKWLILHNNISLEHSKQSTCVDEIWQ